MQVDLAVVCDYATMTADNKMVLVGLFEEIRAPQLPWQHPSMALVFRIRLHPGEAPRHAVSVRLIDPDGQDVIPALDSEVRVPEVDPVDGASASLLLGLNNVGFQKAGPHRFDLLVDGRFEQSVRLLVKVTG